MVSFSTDTHPLHTVTRAHTLLIHGHAAGYVRSSAAQIALPDQCACGQGQRVTQIRLALLAIFCSVRHLEVQIFVASHGSLHTELLLCAEHGRWSDPEDSSATGVWEDKIRSLTFLGVVLARRSPVFSGPWFPLKSHGNACAPLSGFWTSFPAAFSRSLALPRAYVGEGVGSCTAVRGPGPGKRGHLGQSPGSLLLVHSSGRCGRS